MSGFLGRETLMPSAAKRGKRGRKQEKVPTPAPDFDADSESSSSEEDERPPPKKIKTPTKARNISSSSSSSESSDSSSSSDDPEPMQENGGEVKDEVKMEPGSVGNWSVEDLEHLTAVVLKSLTSNDTMKYTKRLERMNWEQIKFGVYSAEDCKKQWVHMYSKVRTHRTMRELASDVKEVVSNNKANFEFLDRNGRLIHPDMPKKPPTAYFKFVAEKRDHYKKKQPELNNIELTKILGKRYNELSDAKKKKYLDTYNEEMKKYKAAYEKFQAEHPELFVPKSKSKSKNNFTRPLSAMQIFINRRTEEHLLENPEANRKKIHDVLKNKWMKMSSARKDKYVKKAIEDKIRLEHDLDEYCKAHPDFDASAVKKMYDRTKVEKEVLDKASGKPAQPPRNAYMYFVSVHMSEPAAGKTTKEHMADVRIKWKNLGAAEKAKHARLFEEKVVKYEHDYAAWKEGLSPEDREKAEAEEAASTPKRAKKEPPAPPRTQTTIMETLQRKPISALFLYLEEKKQNYKKKHPKLSDPEVTEALSKKYEGLSSEKKHKYKALEIKKRKEEKMKLMENGVPASPGRASPSPVPKKVKKKPFPGEPKKAPSSGYSLFSCEQLQGKQLADVPSSQRMFVISKKWKELSVGEREKFKATREKMVAKYKKDVEKFRNSLSPEDRAKFDETHPQNSKSKKKPSAKTGKAEVTQKPKEESEDSSSASSSSSSSESSSSSDSDSEEEVPNVRSPSKVPTPKVKLVSKKSSSSSSSSSDEESEVKRPPVKASPVVTPKIAAKKTADSSDDSSSEDSDSSSSSSIASGPSKTVVSTAVNSQLSSSGSDSDSD
ncbi:nucleolar transcription factor 1-A-like [Lineus longissimus]|uniref:nucleolar transcription factor 1-A-like n=1 Tax=Lineus longissimus TaxID=88925 RepID=UPI002B4DECF7